MSGAAVSFPAEAQWVGAAHPFDLHEAYLDFRSPALLLEAPPGRAELLITADSRYRLWINGRAVARQPRTLLSLAAKRRPARRSRPICRQATTPFPCRSSARLFSFCLYPARDWVARPPAVRRAYAAGHRQSLAHPPQSIVSSARSSCVHLRQRRRGSRFAPGRQLVDSGV